MKKFDKNSAIGFGSVMTVFYIFQSFMTIESFTTKDILITILSSAVGGLLAGVLFGLIIGWFKKSKLVKKAGLINLNENEIVKMQTPANHFKGVEGVGGILFLTNQRLFFKSHKLNIQVHELTIPLSEIKEVSRHRTLGIINNGLSIKTTSDKIEKFVVEKVENWIEQLG